MLQFCVQRPVKYGMEDKLVACNEHCSSYNFWGSDSK